MELSIDIGCVLKLFVNDTNPPKIKRFVIIGKNKENLSLASVYINSTINQNVNWSTEQKALHLEFECNGRSYLDHKSYIDCSKLYFKDLNEIEEAVEKRNDAIIGYVSEEDLELIISTVSRATTIKGKYKKKYGIYKELKDRIE